MQLARGGGLLLFGLATILLVAALLTDLPAGLVWASAGCLIAGATLLAPAMVLSYAVRTAEREDQARGL